MKTFDDWFLAAGEYGSYGVRAEYFFEDVGYEHHNPKLMAAWLRAAYEAGQESVRDDTALLRQALEALEGLFGVPAQWTGAGAGGVHVWNLGGAEPVRAAITALKERLK